MRRVGVAVPLPFETPFDYVLPEDMEAAPGAIVVVPLGPRRVIGVVWSGGQGDVAPERLKAVDRVLPLPPLPADLRAFVDWVARYTLSSLGGVVALCLRSRSLFDPPRPRVFVRATGAAPARLTPARARVLQAAADGLLREPRALAEEAMVGTAVISGLVETGALERVERLIEAPWHAPDPDHAAVALSPAQAAAADRLRAAVAARTFSAALLDGVTGSGKTETYFEAIAACLREGRQALVLLPEIALTVEFLARFEARFGARPAEWHSDVSDAERRRTWLGIARGEARVVVGARSALFLPFADLGLVIVDEEHDQSFKQEDGIIYQARDMAVVRARLCGIPVVLASATPSLETVANVAQGRYERLVLPSRHGAAVMPEIALVDLKAAGLDAHTWLAPELVAATAEALGRGEQAMLFLNRRGYAPLTICRACGHRMMSPHASAALVEHRYTGRLVCHLTGFSMPKPKQCPACAARESLVACGPGVERVAEEARARFPEARIGVMSSDLLQTPGETRALVEAMRAGGLDLLVGTQMVAKGHNFPGLTLVGVVDADMGLKGGDLRAAERTFQLLQQVAGRSGRAERRGRVLIQTYSPEHPVMQALAAHDRDGFYAHESEEREALTMPPYGRLAAIIVTGPDGPGAESCARGLAAAAPIAEGIAVFGPAPAPYAVVRGRHRYRLLVKAALDRNLQAFLRAWLAAAEIPSRIRVTVDVDPYSFL